MAERNLVIDVLAGRYPVAKQCDGCKEYSTRLIGGLGRYRICCHCALDIIGELSKAIQEHGDDAAAEMEKGRSIDATA